MVSEENDKDFVYSWGPVLRRRRWSGRL